MWKPRLILALLCLPMLLAAGCVSAFRVHHVSDKKQLDGIPFYAKTAKCVQTSVYLYPYYRITFQTLSGDKVLGSLTTTLNTQAYRSADTQDFLSILRKKPPLSDADSAKADDDWAAMERASENPFSKVVPRLDAQGNLVKTDVGNLVLISNTAAAKVIVDYSHEYSLNARTPLAGSVKADYKLNEDGSLNETSAEAQDQTLATIAGLFPISDLIKSAAGVAATKAFVPEAPGTVALQATVEKRALKVSYSSASDFGQGCAVAAAIAPGGSNDLTIEDVGPDTTAARDDKSNSISVSGKITLPTPAPAKTSGGSAPAPAPPAATSPGATDQKKPKGL